MPKTETKKMGKFSVQVSDDFFASFIHTGKKIKNYPVSIICKRLDDTLVLSDSQDSGGCHSDTLMAAALLLSIFPS